jgi:protein-S-isoprenylcysteine O-methyltransferase Ste14
MNLLQWILFITGTLFFIFFSWYVSLRAKRFHGFFRFFSFESILIIVILNYPYWFSAPLKPLQFISWIFLFGSALIAAIAFYQFYRVGKPANHMEETTQLITTGMYRFIRHPLYLSLLLAGFGAMLKDPGSIQVLLSILNAVALYLTARTEEKEMIERMGPPYIDYIKKTRMFLPGII